MIQGKIKKDGSPWNLSHPYFRRGDQDREDIVQFVAERGVVTPQELKDWLRLPKKSAHTLYNYLTELESSGEIVWVRGVNAVDPGLIARRNLAYGLFPGAGADRRRLARRHTRGLPGKSDGPPS